MRLKRIFLSFVILNIFLSDFIININASSTDDFKLGIKIGDEYIWEVNVLREFEMKEVLEPEILKYRDYRLGVKMKLRITNIIETENDEWMIAYDFWRFTRYEFESKPEGEGYYYNTFKKDPKQFHYHGYYFTALNYYVSFFYPIPITDYLKIAYRLDPRYKINGTTMTYSQYLYKVNFIFCNDTGIIKSLNYELRNGTVIYEFSLIDILPGYELPVILGFIPILFIGIVYLVVKREKIKIFINKIKSISMRRN